MDTIKKEKSVIFFSFIKYRNIILYCNIYINFEYVGNLIISSTVNLTMSIFYTQFLYVFISIFPYNFSYLDFYKESIYDCSLKKSTNIILQNSKYQKVEGFLWLRRCLRATMAHAICQKSTSAYRFQSLLFKTI